MAAQVLKSMVFWSNALSMTYPNYLALTWGKYPGFILKNWVNLSIYNTAWSLRLSTLQHVSSKHQTSRNIASDFKNISIITVTPVLM